VHVRPLFPLGHSLWIEMITVSELGYAFLTLLDRSTYGLGRAGAAV